MVSRITTSLTAILAGLLMASAASTAYAGNSYRFERSHSDHNGRNQRHGHHDRGGWHSGPRPNPGIIVGGGSITVLPGIGTYSGSISAYRVPGNGTYFGVDRGEPRIVKSTIAPKARIIVVSEQGNEACTYEAGVCVIRP
ncbi:hypothetical protein ACQQ2Q_16390 [Agrobacterium sp. ES01]|uniref:hypothetical protein n=1 Tax=Agrobacterium sp. ES01 TaxID=3420714 RepID=UPI003D0D65EE